MEEADRLAATNPDYAIGDLFNAIANGNYPSWTFFIQVMTFEQAETFQFNPFDLTKVLQRDDGSNPILSQNQTQSFGAC